jgi:hypothetical protein
MTINELAPSASGSSIKLDRRDNMNADMREKIEAARMAKTLLDGANETLKRVGMISGDGRR